MQFNESQGRVLHGLECNPADDILVRLDSAGFVVNASQNAQRLGVELEELLVMPHIADFALPDHREQVLAYFDQVIEGKGDENGIEFPIGTCAPALTADDNDACCFPKEGHWYALHLMAIDDGRKGTVGALGTLQSVQHKFASHQNSVTADTPHSLTGLADRRSFISHLNRTLDQSGEASAAVFAIDGMRAIFMQYGQSTADEISWGFARYLETMAEPQHILAQLDEERIGVILPGKEPRMAREWAADALQIFAGLAAPTSSRAPELTASAGIAQVDLSADWTLRQAELGLVMARAAGGMRAGICQPNARASGGLSSGHSVKRAMEVVLERSEKRAS